MNCEKVSYILDAKEPDAHTAAERQAVEQHLASCAGCRAVWGAYRELVSLRVPATPPHLRAHIMAEIAARPQAGARSVGRGFVVGAVLVAGLAAAMTVALRVADRAADSGPTAADGTIPVVTPSAPVEPESDGVSSAPAATAASVGALPPQPAAPSAVGYPLDRHSVVVMAVPDPAADSEAAAALASCHEAVVAELRGVDGLNVIGGDRLLPFAGSSRSEIEIARELGAASVLALRSMDRYPSCNAVLLDVQSGARTDGLLVFVDPAWRPERWQQFASDLARSVRDKLLNDASTLSAQEHAAVLNPALDDRDRLMALFRLRRAAGARLPLTDEALIAAVIQIGTTSRDPQARQNAWLELRGVTDSAAVQSLLHALANDAEARVRTSAARTLGSVLNEPGVRDALLRASTEDPDEHPSIACCIPTVRSAARLALKWDDEPLEAIRKTVLDASLTPHERLLFMTPQSFGTSLHDFDGDAEVAQAVFELGLAADDPGLRARAWSLLADAGEPSFKPALLEDLARHPAENVRAAAATGLRRHREEPEVRAALERAESDPSTAVQRAARSTLDGVGSSLTLPPSAR